MIPATRTARLARCLPTIGLDLRNPLCKTGTRIESVRRFGARPEANTNDNTASPQTYTTVASAAASPIAASSANANAVTKSPSRPKMYANHSSTKSTMRPKASNPAFFRQRFDDNPLKAPAPVKQPPPVKQPARQDGTLAKQLEAGSGERLPTSCWVRVDNIPPLSSLDAMLTGVKKALDIEQGRGGIVDLDALWKPDQDETIPFLPPTNTTTDNHWVQTAQVILSPFGRPTGWNLRFANRSVVYAFLTQARETPIQCAWKKVGITEVRGKVPEPSVQQSQISHATLRIENCPDDTTVSSLLRFFSRYDLTPQGPSVVQWHGETVDGKKAPMTFLVHFADASWARAALREKQASIMRGKTLRLAQYPKQIL